MSLTDHRKLLIARKVADAIHYLHCIPCTHQDIKPHNVIVSHKTTHHCDTVGMYQCFLEKYNYVSK